MRKPSLLPLIAAAFALTACGGGGSSAPPPVVSRPPPPPPPPPPVLDFSAVQARVDTASVANMAVLVGDASGVLFAYEKGTYRRDGTVFVASASKMMVGLTVWASIEAGQMSVADQPQDHIGFWTNIAGDGRSEISLDQLLGFTSGFNEPPSNPGCISQASFTLSACVENIYDDGLDTMAGTSFYYGPEHMQIAALMLVGAEGQSFSQVMRTRVLDLVGASTQTVYSALAGDNPRYSGNLRSTADDFALVLTAILNGDLVADRAGYLRDRTAGVTFGHRPPGLDGSSGRDWHYGFGFWKECDDLTYTSACDDAPVISSPGAFGFTPWIDFDKGYWGIIAMQEVPSGSFSPVNFSVGLEQDIQPLIEAALGL